MFNEIGRHRDPCLGCKLGAYQLLGVVGMSDNPRGQFLLRGDEFAYEIALRIEKFCPRNEDGRDRVRFFDKDFAASLAFESRNPRFNRPNTVQLFLFEKEELVRVGGGQNLRVAPHLRNMQSASNEP
jgi:hypothetical protein